MLQCASFSDTLSGEVAQLVEQRTENSRVVGSIPTLATIAPIVYRLGHGLFMPVRGVRLSLGVPRFTRNR